MCKAALGPTWVDLVRGYTLGMGTEKALEERLPDRQHLVCIT
jgi:hypothetical protein